MTFCPLYSWKIIIRDPSLWLLVHKIKHHYCLFYFYFLDDLCSLSLETNGGPNGTTLRPHPTGLCNTCQMSLRFREVVQIFFNVGYLFFLKLCFFEANDMTGWFPHGIPQRGSLTVGGSSRRCGGIWSVRWTLCLFSVQVSSESHI